MSLTTSIIAHRGASKYAPENTMPAFQLAYDMKADGIETDVHLTKDNIPVIIHDEKVDRTTNGKGFIKDLTYEQLQELDSGSWFAGKFVNTKIITLKDLLQWARFKPLYLNIELKNNKIDYKHLETIVYDLIKQYNFLDRVTLSTFNPNSVQRMKSLQLTADIAFLTSKRRKDLVTYLKKLGANAIHVNERILERSLVEEAHKEGLSVRVFTVNKRSSIKRVLKYRCDGIITDVPDKAKKYQYKFEK